ncbi:MAG: GGDEF domain-containing protein [Candidatus Eremiobacteraeota bacterium]|nr:GGDEF domain-containing protein [Candidatus Eremiobacteraeota bacterium]NNM93164.1 GGDEF domain-containing protein [Candidatus Eremiobacteraeota bacterium]
MTSIFFGNALTLLATLGNRTPSPRRERGNPLDGLDGMPLLRSAVAAIREGPEAVVRAFAERGNEERAIADNILLFVPSGDELHCRQRFGNDVEYALEMRVRLNDSSSLVANAWSARHALFASTNVLPMLPTERSGCAIPLIDNDVPIAVLYCGFVQRQSSSLLEGTCVLASEIAVPFALACERERDLARSLYDGLTGLLTPRAFRERLARVLDEDRNGGKVALWFVDTDRFKEVNDSFGHAVGDRVLQQMAELLRTHAVARTDFVARNGGDEFCAALIGIPKTLAIERAQDFCDAVRSHDFGIPLRLTASIGVAAYPFDARTAATLLERADRAMYAGKKAGRDRVSFALEGRDPALYR